MEPRAKLSISMSPSMVEMVDTFAKSLGINRSAAISVLVTQAFEYKTTVEMAKQIPNMLKEMQTVQENQLRLEA